MLGRHIIGYIPSLVVPGIAAFGAIYCYTRILTPAEYGHYALALNLMTLLNAVFFYWLQTPLPRLMPRAVKDAAGEALRTTATVAFGGVSLLVIAGALLVLAFVPLGDFAPVVWLAVPLAITRALLTMKQAFHRSSLNFGRYNLLECGQAILGLAIGLPLVWFFHLSTLGAVGGMIIGMTIMALVDLQGQKRMRWRMFSRPMLEDIARYGLPLVFSYGFAVIISGSDRFIIEYFRGAGEVGMYAAGYTLMDRINTILYMMVALPAFPLTVHRLEHEGVEAARSQTYHNGVAMLALGVPACVGLLLTNAQLAAVFIGPDFREAATRVMPWIAASAILNGMSTHYFDHAFHLGRKTHMLLYTQGPAALLNLGMNIVLIPRIGYIGAVYSTLCSYALLLTLSICVGRRAFPIRFPFRPALEIAACTALMAAVLLMIPFPATLAGLVAMVILGGAVYVLGLLTFNVVGIRGKALRRLKYAM